MGIRRILGNILLLDADIVISAHEFEIWKKLTKVAKVHLPSTIIKKESYYYKNKFGFKIPLNLHSQLQKEIIFEESASPYQEREILKKLPIVQQKSIHDGEKEALAIMKFTKKNFIFCTADAAAIRALVTLDLRDKSSSFEGVLKKCGLKDCLPSHFYKKNSQLSDKYFKYWLKQGSIEYVTHVTLKNTK